MPSKMVIERQKTAQSLISAMTTFKDTLQTALDDLTARLPRDTERFDLGPLLNLLALVVQDAIAALIAADADNEREHTEDSQDRAERDAATSQLVSLLVELGEALSTLYGRDARRAVGLQGDTPRDPQTAQEVATRAVAALPGLRFTPRVKGATFDPTAYADDLRAGAQRVEAALGALSLNVRETDQTQIKKDAAMSHYHKAYLKVATLFEAFCRVADLDELADRVRQSTKRADNAIQTDGVQPPASPADAAQP
jgi:hypothetical protein